MTDEQLRNALHGAMERRLSGMQDDPCLARRVLTASKGEEPMKKKISVSIIMIALLLAALSIALAAGLGLFDKLAERASGYGENLLSGLSAVSDSMGVALTTEDGVTVEIDQCYYEGNRLFLSYRVSGNTYAAALHEGEAPKQEKWDWIEKDFVYAENMISEMPEDQAAIDWLDGKGRRWAETYHASLHDGLMLLDGTYLDIYAGEIYPQEDGSVIGWKECRVPEDRLTDTLECKAVLFRTTSIQYQNGRDYYQATTRGESTDIPFTVRRNDHFTWLGGACSNGTYTASAAFTLGQIDLNGTVLLDCPEEWFRAHTDWDYHSEEDLIETWWLYAGEELLSDQGLEGEQVDGERALLFEFLFSRPQTREGLRLVPVYTKSGAHPDEAISLEELVNR